MVMELISIFQPLQPLSSVVALTIVAPGVSKLIPFPIRAILSVLLGTVLLLYGVWTLRQAWFRHQYHGEIRFEFRFRDMFKKQEFKANRPAGNLYLEGLGMVMAGAFFILSAVYVTMRKMGIFGASD